MSLQEIDIIIKALTQPFGCKNKIKTTIAHLTCTKYGLLSQYLINYIEPYLILQIIIIH